MIKTYQKSNDQVTIKMSISEYEFLKSYIIKHYNKDESKTVKETIKDFVQS